MAKGEKKQRLSKPLGGGGKLPSKTSINLMIIEHRAKRNLAALLVFLLFMAGLAVFVKFMVIDQIDEINRMEVRYNQQVQMLETIQRSNEIYEQVRAEYSHYGNGYLNEEEMALQDRLDVLEVVEEELLEKDALKSISISGNVAQLTINSEKLSNVSEIVASLEDRDNVEYVTVSNSATDETAGNTPDYQAMYQALASVLAQQEEETEAVTEGDGFLDLSAESDQLQTPQEDSSSEEALLPGTALNQADEASGEQSQTPQTDEFTGAGDRLDPEEVVTPVGAVALEQQTQEETPSDLPVSGEIAPEESDGGAASSREAAALAGTQEEPETEDETETELDLSETGLTLEEIQEGLMSGLTLEEILAPKQVVVTTMTIYFKSQTELDAEEEMEQFEAYGDPEDQTEDWEEESEAVRTAGTAQAQERQVAR